MASGLELPERRSDDTLIDFIATIIQVGRVKGEPAYDTAKKVALAVLEGDPKDE